MIKADRTKGNAQVIYKTMKKNLWHEMNDKLWESATNNSINLGADSQKIALDQLTKPVVLLIAPIPESTASLLEQVWTEMLARVHYPELQDDGEIEVGTDGVTYHVSHFSMNDGFRSGSSWSPEKGSNTGALVELAEELRQYAIANEKERAQIEITIRDKANALLEKLNK